MRFKLSYLINHLSKFAYQFFSREEALAELGLGSDSSVEDIKKAYRKKVFELHPDKNNSPTANDDLARLNLAYKYLTTDKEEKNKPNPPPEPIHQPINIEFEDLDDSEEFYPSYEKIAEEFKDLGEVEFNKKYPGWKSELMSEMGLENFNSTFYGMSDADQEQSQMDYERSWEIRAENLEYKLADFFSDLYDKLSDTDKAELTNYYLTGNLNLNTILSCISDESKFNQLKKMEDETERDLKKAFEEICVEKVSEHILKDLDPESITKDILKNMGRVAIFKVLYKVSFDKLRELFLDDIAKSNNFQDTILNNFPEHFKPHEVIQHIIAHRKDIDEICELIEEPLMKVFAVDNNSMLRPYLKYLPNWFLMKMRNYPGRKLHVSWIDSARARKKEEHI